MRLIISAAMLVLFALPGHAQSDPATRIDQILDAAEAMAPLETVLVAHEGKIVAQRGYRGHSASEPTNIKSASKLVISALVGIAIDKGVLDGTDQLVAPILQGDLPADPDPRLSRVTIGNLLSMQAGLESTSGPNYGAWVGSRNWVRSALARPFVDEPGGGMIYSTGSSHLLSAILTRQTGRSTMELARDWLGPLEGFRITAWEHDPQGIYLGGNQMAMTPRSLLALGELYRNHGMTPGGKRLISQDWIDASWLERTRSRYTGGGYGYGWFMGEVAGRQVRYGWGYGGQMVYVVPALGLTVVMTSDETTPSAATRHREALYALLGQIVSAFDPAKDSPTDGQ
ncbi:class C beta-lactamase-related serine hydrolase [Paracoccus suum]|uniref:Class C beta-lactamase-related serine hydrolase n=1 Tax=Paracoccus suum TaxID=2259340 RepID=A0A344PMY2_9RHOB|nr:serine hydrolase [Paracoccus suum]AXC50737.1 class C beta-lactamase-related serine hydrolase [Paracoccus suum]